jgi:putative nucleotidyltransferase with HDIG domain
VKHKLLFPSESQKILKAVHLFAGGRRVKPYLVGGALRDLILGRARENPDFDFAVKKGAISFGRQMAREFKCGFVVLDREHGSCRLVKKSGDNFYTLDFTDFRGASLEDDLKRRDFTINSIALKLEDALSGSDFSPLLIDPCSGLPDIRKGIIRAVNKASFSEDPLRVMRAFSFCALLGFTIHKDTLKYARLYKDKLPGVSAERIRDELFKVFASDKAYECFLRLDKIRILDIIFPEIKKMRKIGQGPYHHLDVWQHTLETLKQLEAIFSALKSQEILDYLNAVISGQRKRRELLKFGAFLHDFGKPKALRRIKGKTIFHGHERIGLGMAQDIAKRLKLSNDEVYSLHKMVLWHLRPGYLADSEHPTARAKFRYFRDAGIESLSILLLSLADQRATKGPLTTPKARTQHEKIVGRLIKEHLDRGKEEKPQRLLNGDEVMRRFGLKPSPLVGRILSLVDELQGIGRIKTKEEAFKAASRLAKSK